MQLKYLRFYMLGIGGGQLAAGAVAMSILSRPEPQLPADWMHQYLWDTILRPDQLAVTHVIGIAALLGAWMVQIWLLRLRRSRRH